MELKLPYGLKNNELVSIVDVTSGLDCDCICPACKEQLIARKGAIKIHHFAHYKSVDCLGGLETALHKLSKEIIAKSKTFKTPALYYPNTTYEIYEETEIPVDNVTLETRVDEIIPDIVIESKGKKLLIEIVVTNKVKFNKAQRIRSENLPTIVVYAKYILETLYTNKDFGLQDNLFQRELVNGARYKFWLHNPKIRIIKKKLLDNYAEVKLVQYFKSEEIGYYYFVEHCPLSKRAWKSGKNSGKPYAAIERDCKECEFCLSIVYKDIPYKRIRFHEFNPSLDYYTIPEKVYCIGYLKNDFRNLIKQLK